VMLRQPASSYKPRSAAAKAIQALADELLARLVSPRNAAAGEAA
jgi:chromosome partitioning protein